MSTSRPVAACLALSLALAWLCALTTPIWPILLGLVVLLLAGIMHVVPWLAARPVKTDTPRPAPGLLSMADFAAACDKRLRVQIDDDPEPPDPLPAPLRDPGFARREQAIESARQRLEAARDFERKLGGIITGRYHAERWFEREREAEDKLRKLQSQPAVADRSFTARTHCAHGHIGDHWLDELTDDGQTVWRTCRWAKCGIKWQEQAWTTAAT